MYQSINKYEDNRLIEVFETTDTGSLYLSESYSYDSHGNLLLHRSYYPETIYEPYETHWYDDFGNKIESIYYRTDKSIQSREENKYDDKMNCISSTYYRVEEDGDDEVKSVYIYQYDTDNNLIKEDKIHPETKQLIESTIYENELKIHKKLISSSGELSREETWEYDDEGLKSEYSKYKKGDLVFREIWKRSPNMKIYTKEKFENKISISTFKKITIYNLNRNWISKEIYENGILDEKTIREIEYY